MKPFVVSDLNNPVGEEKRVVAALKSWGSRNADNVTAYEAVVTIGGVKYVEMMWASHKGEFNKRSWIVSVLFDSEMRSPGLCKLTVSGSDDEFYTYLIPRSHIDKWISQRIGNDCIPDLFNDHQAYWLENGGYVVGGYVTMPAWAQWGLGAMYFHHLKVSVQQMLMRNDVTFGDSYKSIEEWYEDDETVYT